MLTLSTDEMDRWSKLFYLINEFVKLSAIVFSIFVMLLFVVSPQNISDIFKQVEISAGPFKIAVASEAKSMAMKTLQISEALTEAEIRLTDLSGEVQDASLSTSRINDQGIDEVIKNIVSARATLDQQFSAIQITGKSAGISMAPPARGWIYIGVFNENGKLVFPSNRIQKQNGLVYSRNQLEEIILRSDAVVTSDGDDCTKIDISDFEPSNEERRYAVLRASHEPLRVISTKSCNAPGGNRTVYAEIKVPSNRVRFSSFSELPK